MTRDNLVQAIYDNTDEWSCKSPCPHIMEEENPKDVCMKCAEKQLAEYEQQLKADAIDEFKDILLTTPLVGKSIQQWIDDACKEVKEGKNGLS